MSADIQTRMRNRGGQQASSVMAAPVSTAQISDADILFGPSGKVTHRQMTEEEKQMISQGQSPTSNLSEVEKRQLLKMGWTEGQPVPPNIQEIFQRVIAETQVQPTVPGHLPKELPVTDISSLPSQEQERVKSAMQSAIAAAVNNTPSKSTVEFTNYPPQLAEAMQQMANIDKLAPVAIPGWDDGTAAKGTSPAVVAPASAVQPEQQSAEPISVNEERRDITPSVSPNQRCVHCGGDPFEDLEKSPIDLEDKRKFILSIGTGGSFEKEYLIFNKTILVRFRARRAGESDLIDRWANEKAQEEIKYRRLYIEDFHLRVQYYAVVISAALQTTYVKSAYQKSNLYWTAPEGNNPGLKDWTDAYQITTLDALLENFHKAMGSDAVVVAIRERLMQFNALDYKLMSNANDVENFWTGT